MTTALYPGSFDPLHLGHLGIIEQSANIFDEVIVAVLGNPAKPSGMFTIADRIRMAVAATAHLANVRCVGYHGLAVDLARAEHADVLVRSAHKDTGHERSMAAMNEALSGIGTFFVAPDATTSSISSSVVRELLSKGKFGAAVQLVPQPLRAALHQRPAAPSNS